MLGLIFPTTTNLKNIVEGSDSMTQLLSQSYSS